ncbi:MAG: hypothetical protein JJ934_07445 [Pseudomonadales bacterium]|nr:hypothetical protein [Pseudomonadales bacterium]MBO6656710.1 hypothetical protein [Pseudomonadales bacterium]MBO6701035.1 hypothetical protein [Pseudomonadales bacterium]MBO7007931.1 hypothetical protein [Pseudomonadales bacterium]
MAKRRDFNVFSLSFLDIMSCGFGAVILIYIIINHATETTSQEINTQLLAEIKRYEEQVKDAQENLIVLKNTAEEKEDEIVTTEEMAVRLIETIKALEAELALLLEDGASQNESIEDLKSELKDLELEAANLEGAVSADETVGTALRTVVGEGDRQYLTGMKVGGQHILILLDASASMLDNTIVNVIRRRNLSEEEKLASPKWQRAVATVEWITANMPKDANFQLFTFNADTQPAIEGTESDWLKATERADTDGVIESISETVPTGGTSLHNAFALARNLEPQPDNIFLIVDSLPTMGVEAPRRSVIESRDRVELFSRSLELLPNASPVNVILFPMEGDPVAAPSYWKLAQVTGGSFLSPPEDWP